MTFRKVIILTLVFFSSFFAFSHERGDHLEIAVMTIGPYQGELYSAFGHSGIRVIDSLRNKDYVFHYGVFNFDQENFYWNFARGYMIYQIGLASYDRFKKYYVSENRYIKEQYLNLTPDEKWELYQFLLDNYKPQNREYLYNYVYDNCASKIRDVLRDAIPAEIEYNYAYAEKGLTVRDLMDRYLAYQPWGDWIIDVGLGGQIDREADPEVYMFLPDYVFKALEKGTIKRDSVTVPLVNKTIQVNTPEPEEQAVGVFTPFNTFVLVFFIIGFFTNRDYKRGKRSHWVDVVLFTFVGIFGWWCTFLWFGTVHLSKENMNLFWAIPLHIPFIYLLNVKKFQPFVSKYFLFVGVWYLLLLIIWGMLPQPLHDAIIPLVLTMILRCFYINYDINKFSKTKR